MYINRTRKLYSMKKWYIITLTSHGILCSTELPIIQIKWDGFLRRKSDFKENNHLFLESCVLPYSSNNEILNIIYLLIYVPTNLSFSKNEIMNFTYFKELAGKGWLFHEAMLIFYSEDESNLYKHEHTYNFY